MPSSGPRVPALTILSHPEVDRVGERAVLWEADAKDGEALLARRQLDFQPPRGKGSPRPLGDPYLSRRPIRLTAARFGGIRIDCTRTSTRMIANDDWVSEDRVFLGVEVERGVVLVLSERLALVLHNLDPNHTGDDRIPGLGLVGESSAIQRVRRQIRQLAADTLPVLVRGEAGTGKKTVARAIHDAGNADRPFVALRLVDERSPPSVAELLSRAAGGTLVLDAVHRIEEELQHRLLRALKDRRDVRLVATCVEESSRRSPPPLLEELDWSVVDVPALNRRRDDVGRLVFHFLRDELAKLDAFDRLADPGPYAAPWFPVRLVAAFASHHWSSNVRQLRRVTDRLVRDYHDRDYVDAHIDLDSFLSEENSTGWGWSEDREGSRPASTRPEKLTEAQVLSALRAHRWQAEPAAAQLGVAPDVLFDMMEKLFNQGQQGGKPRR